MVSRGSGGCGERGGLHVSRDGDEKRKGGSGYTFPDYGRGLNFPILMMSVLAFKVFSLIY